MYSLRNDRRLMAFAPAKVNLSLEVLARRPDGFHELETLMVATSLCDTLELTATSSPELTVHCQWALGLQAECRSQAVAGAHAWQPLPATTDNLVWKALDRLRRATGCSRGATVTLVKRIPAQAGLGGASADAAATLLAANRAWELNLPAEQLADIAAELGSDVPFFLGQGAGICRGRGERIEAFSFPSCWLVLVRPPVGLSTPAVFRHCHPEPGRQVAKQLCAAIAAGNLAAAARGMHNGLQAPAEQQTPWIQRLAEAFRQVGSLGHQMSGSGSTYFGWFWQAAQARRAAAVLRGRNLGAVMVARTLSQAMNAQSC
jgi:4-diphosphocytidyl-2-C-methyl-D-erythritol kinase